MSKHRLYNVRLFEASYSTRQFADLAGVSPRTLTDIESRKTATIHIATARALVTALQLRLPRVTIKDVFNERELCESACKAKKCVDYRLASDRLVPQPEELEKVHPVKWYRDRTGLSLPELAEEADLSVSVVYRIERRSHEWHTHRDTARALYRVLKQHLPQLLFDDLFEEEELSDLGRAPHIKHERVLERSSIVCPECHLEMPTGKRRCGNCDWEDSQGLRIVGA